MWWNGASCCEFDGKLMVTETTWSEFPNGGKAIVEEMLASEEEKTPKGKIMRITVWDPSRKVNHVSKIIWDRKIIWTLSPGQSVPPE